MRFRIVQCLCGPNRHAIAAIAVNVDVAEMPNDQAIDGLRQILAAANLNPWCGICGSGAWMYEIGWSIPFPDWETAQRMIREQEADQRSTRALLDALDLTFDARQRTQRSTKH